MKKRALAAGITLLVCLGGCRGSAGNNQADAATGAAGAENGAAPAAEAAAPAANGVAVAGNVAAPSGPCPFPSRGWRAVVEPGETPGQLRIALTGEVRHDDSGRAPAIASEDGPPPTIFLDILSAGAMPDGPGASVWQEGTSYFVYRPGHNLAVIRCNGREVARVPIAPPPGR